MEDIVDDVINVMLIIAIINLFLSFLALPRKVNDLEEKINDLENKVEELEQRNLEAHEYILNRIGG